MEDYGRRAVRQALRRGTLVLHLGPFAMQLKADSRALLAFLLSMYGACHATLEAGVLADFSLHVRAPNMIRRFVRRQITPDPGFYFPTVPLPRPMAPLALEMGMNLAVALQCFRFAIYHAGVVADERGAIAISAFSGGGKSTLTAALMEEGFRLLSDEFAIMGLDEPGLYPYPRPVSLKNASVEIVRAFAGAEEMSTTLTGTPKGDIGYRRARPHELEMMHEPAMPKLLLFPQFSLDAEPRAEKVEPGDAVMRFIAGSPNYHALGEAAFGSLMAFADSVAAYDLHYGNTADSIALVKDLWREHGS
nr:HprK-related kinase A [Kordiimonas marina]